MGGNVRLGNCVGDFWVDGGAGAAGKYEDINGNWAAIGSPVGYYTRIDATEGNPSTVTVATSPANATIRYTTDGSLPTASSGQYAGPLSLNVSNRPMVLRTLATSAGGDSGRSSKIILPSCKPLPAGYIKELLCLVDANGKQGVPPSDTPAICARYAGTNKPGAFEGESITVNGRTYTWHLQQDADGIFEPAGPFPGEYSAFWFTYLVSPQVQTVKLGAHFTGQPQFFCNGRLVGYFDGWSGETAEFNVAGYPFGFGLDKGANGILVKTESGGWGMRFGMRVTTPGTDLGNLEKVTGVDITNLKYYPYSGLVQSAAEPKMQPARPSVSLSLSGNTVQIHVATSTACALSVCNARGEIVAGRRTLRQGTWRVDGLSAGWYMLNMVSNDTSRKLPFVLQR
jgi:hypothetical protein